MAYEPKFSTFKAWDGEKTEDGAIIVHSLGCNGGMHVDSLDKVWYKEGTTEVDYAEPHGNGEPTLCDGTCEAVKEYKGGFLYRPPTMALVRLTCEEFRQMLLASAEPSDNDKTRAAEHINHCGSCCYWVDNDLEGAPEWVENAQRSRVLNLLDGNEPDAEFK